MSGPVEVMLIITNTGRVFSILIENQELPLTYPINKKKYRGVPAPLSISST